MKRDTHIEYLLEEIRKILGIKYYSPHAPPPGTEWKEDRCGNCSCAAQVVHNHASMDTLVECESLLQMFIRELNI